MGKQYSRWRGDGSLFQFAADRSPPLVTDDIIDRPILPLVEQSVPRMAIGPGCAPGSARDRRSRRVRQRSDRCQRPAGGGQATYRGRLALRGQLRPHSCQVSERIRASSSTSATTPMPGLSTSCTSWTARSTPSADGPRVHPARAGQERCDDRHIDHAVQQQEIGDRRRRRRGPARPPGSAAGWPQVVRVLPRLLRDGGAGQRGTAARVSAVGAPMATTLMPVVAVRQPPRRSWAILARC